MEVQSQEYSLNSLSNYDQTLKDSISLSLSLNSNTQKWIKFGAVFLISNIFAVSLMIVNQAWSQAHSIIIEPGCHGPEMGFAFVAGIIQLLYLKYSKN